MTVDLGRYKEAYKRGLLNEDQNARLEELERRGLVKLEKIQTQEPQVQENKKFSFRNLADEINTPMVEKNPIKEYLRLDRESAERTNEKLRKKNAKDIFGRQIKSKTKADILADTLNFASLGLKPGKGFLEVAKRLAKESALAGASGAVSSLDQGADKAVQNFLTQATISGALGLVPEAVVSGVKGGYQLAKKSSKIADEYFDRAVKLGKKYKDIDVSAEGREKLSQRVLAEKDKAKQNILNTTQQLIKSAQEIINKNFSDKKIISDVLDEEISKTELKSGIQKILSKYKQRASKDFEKGFSNDAAKEIYNDLSSTLNVAQQTTKKNKLGIPVKGRKVVKTATKPSTVYALLSKYSDKYKEGPGINTKQKLINEVERDLKKILKESPTFKRFMDTSQKIIDFDVLASKTAKEKIFEPTKAENLLKESVGLGTGAGLGTPIKKAKTIIKNIFDLQNKKDNIQIDTKNMNSGSGLLSKFLKQKPSNQINDKVIKDQFVFSEFFKKPLNVLNTAQDIIINPEKNKDILNYLKEYNPELVETIQDTYAKGLIEDASGFLNTSISSNQRTQVLLAIRDTIAGILGNPKFILNVERFKQSKAGQKLGKSAQFLPSPTRIGRSLINREINRENDGSYSKEFKKEIGGK